MQQGTCHQLSSLRVIICTIMLYSLSPLDLLRQSPFLPGPFICTPSLFLSVYQQCFCYCEILNNFVFCGCWGCVHRNVYPISNPDLFGWLIRSLNHISNLYSKWLSGHTLVPCQSMLIRQEEIFPNQVVLVPFFKSSFLNESLSSRILL